MPKPLPNSLTKCTEPDIGCIFSYLPTKPAKAFHRLNEDFTNDAHHPPNPDPLQGPASG